VADDRLARTRQAYDDQPVWVTTPVRDIMAGDIVFDHGVTKQVLAVEHDDGEIVLILAPLDSGQTH